MKVKYATQIFSKSMANGIAFYKNKNYGGLDNSGETIHFTILMNDLFDALNRKFPAEGIQNSSKDLEVLKNTLLWLEEWELNLKNELIKEDEFLTTNTAEGLKVTTKSTIDLVDYLLNQCGFKYVLTAKINQDCLEKFFSIIRQIAGPNDHPSTPTFLQLYRMLSVYSVIKPPKTGNCTILEDNVPAISNFDLKNLVKEQGETLQRTQIINKLKGQINTIIENDHWELDDVFQDHNYCIQDSTVFECVVYFLAGYITRRLKKSTKCNICINSLHTEYSESADQSADLINIKTKGFLTYPKHHLFQILKKIELSFMKYAESVNVFENTYEDFFQDENVLLTFPCNEHKTSMMTNIFVMYITMRMRQVSCLKNRDSKKKII